MDVTLGVFVHNQMMSCDKFLQVELSDIWKSKYEEWLEVEVFSNPRDWDAIIASPTAFMECKAMEL